jgi:hypothetical protein
MCEVKSKEKTTKNKPKKRYSGQQRNEMDYDEPHLMLNEKMQPIHWTKQPTNASVANGSLWPYRWANVCSPFQHKIDSHFRQRE